MAQPVRTDPDSFGQDKREWGLLSVCISISTLQGI